MGKGEPSGNLTEFCTCTLQDSSTIQNIFFGTLLFVLPF